MVDDSDSDILSSVIISDEMVDYDTPGKYEVSVYAINSSGVSSTKSFYVSVVENNILELKDYIIFGLSFCLIAIVIVCLVILIKRKKQNQFKNIE